MSFGPDVDAYRRCTERVAEWFASQLTPEGMIRDEPDLIAYAGHWARARRAGQFLLDALVHQPAPDEAFYGRFRPDGEVIDGVPDGAGR